MEMEMIEGHQNELFGGAEWDIGQMNGIQWFMSCQTDCLSVFSV
jgi:hypothetical protein